MSWRIVHHACVCPSNNFTSITTRSIRMKLHRQHPLNVFNVPSLISSSCYPCKIYPFLWQPKNLLLPNWLSNFQIIWLKCSLDDPFIRFLQAMLIGLKTMPPGGRVVLHNMAVVIEFLTYLNRATLSLLGILSQPSLYVIANFYFCCPCLCYLLDLHNFFSIATWSLKLRTQHSLVFLGFLTP